MPCGSSSAPASRAKPNSSIVLFLPRCAARQLARSTSRLLTLAWQADIEAIKLKSRVVLYAIKGEACPLFFDVSLGRGPPQLLPTVFAAWREPTILPTILTHAGVSGVVLRGADLMAPGVLVPPSLEAFPDLPAGAVVLVRALGNPSPFAVGVLEQATHAARSSGMRGRFVRVLHRFRDTLWEFGGRAVPNEGFDRAEIRQIPGFLHADAAASGWAAHPGADQASEAVIIADHDSATSESDQAAAAMPHEAVAMAAAESSSEAVGVIAGSDDTGGSVAVLADSDSCAAAESSVQETTHAASASSLSAAAASPAPAPVASSASSDDASDDLLSRLAALSPTELVEACALQALRTRLKPSQLPLLASLFYAAHLLPCRPQGTRVDVRASRFRKVSVLLEHLASVGVLTLEEAEGGVLSIIAVNRAHPLLVSHRPWPRSLTAGAQEATSSSDDAAGGGDAVMSDAAPIGARAAQLVPPEVTDLLRPSGRIEAIYASVFADIARQHIAPPASDDDGDRTRSSRPPTLPGLDVSHLRRRSAGRPRASARPAATGSGQADSDDDSDNDDDDDDDDNASAFYRSVLAEPLVAVRSRLYSGPESIRVLAHYIAMNRLGSHPTDRSMLLLDSQLVAALGRAVSIGPAPAVSAADFPALGSTPSRETADSRIAGCAAKRDVNVAFGRAHEPWFLLTKANGDVLAKPGSAPTIEIEVSEIRGKRKRVTHVRNLEALALPAVTLMHASKQRFACSATIQPVPIDPSRNEVLIQGDVAEGVEEYLAETFGVPRRLMRIAGAASTKSKSAGPGR